MVIVKILLKRKKKLQNTSLVNCFFFSDKNKRIYVYLDFDAKSLYSRFIWDEKSKYIKIETSSVLRLIRMMKIFKYRILKHLYKAGIKVLFNNPSELIIQHLPGKEKVEKTEMNRMSLGYIIDLLTSVDYQWNVTVSGIVSKVIEVVAHEENFRSSPFRKFIENLFKLKLK